MRVFSDLSRAKNIVRVIEEKLHRNDVKGNKNYFKLAQCSSYRKFELPRAKLKLMYEGNAWESYFGLS